MYSVCADFQDIAFQEQQFWHSDGSDFRNICTVWWKRCGQNCIEMEKEEYTFHIFWKEKLCSQESGYTFHLRFLLWQNSEEKLSSILHYLSL